MDLPEGTGHAVDHPADVGERTGHRRIHTLGAHPGEDGPAIPLRTQFYQMLQLEHVRAGVLCSAQVGDALKQLTHQADSVGARAEQVREERQIGCSAGDSLIVQVGSGQVSRDHREDAGHARRADLSGMFGQRQGIARGHAPHMYNRGHSAVDDIQHGFCYLHALLQRHEEPLACAATEIEAPYSLGQQVGRQLPQHGQAHAPVRRGRGDQGRPRPTKTRHLGPPHAGHLSPDILP